MTFYTGVPDSYLNGFNNYLKANIPAERNVITANEGNAIALASGYHFATGNIAQYTCRTQDWVTV